MVLQGVLTLFGVDCSIMVTQECQQYSGITAVSWSHRGVQALLWSSCSGRITRVSIRITHGQLQYEPGSHKRVSALLMVIFSVRVTQGSFIELLMVIFSVRVTQGSFIELLMVNFSVRVTYGV